MKKSLLNIAVTTALSSALFSASVLSTQVYADPLMSADNNNSNDNTTETYMLPGMGAGAAAGAVVAGPVGLLIGGIIGAFVGENQQVTYDQVTYDGEETLISDASLSKDTSLFQDMENTSDNEVDQQNDTALSGYSANKIHVAQLGYITPVIEEQSSPVQDELVNILTTDLSLDIYFRSGSTAIETFYPARLAAIADLINNMDQLSIHLDGYADRRGNKTQNITLAKQRIDKVREQLINAGVDEHRIISKAFGEMKMVSTAGDLEAYTFDRKVVIRFERATADSIQSMTTALSDPGTESTDPVIADANTRF